MLRLLISDRPAKHFVHRLGDNQPFPRREGNEGVGPGFDVTDQICVEDEGLAAQAGARETSSTTPGP